MNYPDGMTEQDWKHLDDERHYPDCPQHEDFTTTHSCLDSGRCVVEYARGFWRIPGFRPLEQVIQYLYVDFCPLCGEELVWPDCMCDEITEGMQERAAEFRLDALGFG